MKNVKMNFDSSVMTKKTNNHAFIFEQPLMDAEKYKKMKRKISRKRKIINLVGIIGFYGTLASLTGPFFKVFIGAKLYGKHLQRKQYIKMKTVRTYPFPKRKGV